MKNRIITDKYFYFSFAGIYFGKANFCVYC